MEHRCRRGEHCPDYENVDGTRLGRAINATDGLCDTCTRHVERAIAELPADYTKLNLVLGKGTTVGGEPVRMTKELPIPIRLHIEALQRDVVYEAEQWARSVATVMRVQWTLAGPVRPGFRLARACDDGSQWTITTLMPQGSAPLGDSLWVDANDRLGLGISQTNQP